MVEHTACIWSIRLAMTSRSAGSRTTRSATGRKPNVAQRGSILCTIGEGTGRRGWFSPKFLHLCLKRARAMKMRTVHAVLFTGAAAIASGMCLSTPASAQNANGCAGLAKLAIAPAEIGLPSGGVKITSAQIATVIADPAQPDGPKREYCKVLGAILPVDASAPPVNFQVNLPLQWNGKAVQYGGGATNGVLITGLAPLRDARADTPVPVARGFATWGTYS